VLDGIIPIRKFPTGSRFEVNYSLRLVPLLPLGGNAEATCWKPLFSRTVMAYGFPVRTCLGTLGLRIPSQALLWFADISWDVTYRVDEGDVLLVYFVRVFWILIPTKHIKEVN
jgi:hypothetical protein